MAIEKSYKDTGVVWDDLERIFKDAEYNGIKQTPKRHDGNKRWPAGFSLACLDCETGIVRVHTKTGSNISAFMAYMERESAKEEAENSKEG